jgi:HNH endonuclease
MKESEQTRVCRDCGEEKPLSEFPKDRKALLGRSRLCKVCAARKTRLWRQNNIDYAKEQAANKRIDPIYREWHRQYVKDHYNNNEDYYKKKSNDWYYDNYEYARARQNSYGKTPEGRAVKNAAEARRRARKMESGGSFTVEEIENLLDLQRHRCANPACDCGKRGKPADLRLTGYHVDHRIPLIHRGSNDISNIQLLCPMCNMRKHTKDPIIWAQENGFLL